MVELHAYALPEPPASDPDRVALQQQIVARLHALYPETAQAGVLGERLLYRRDCPRLGPGDFAERPTVATSTTSASFSSTARAAPSSPE